MTQMHRASLPGELVWLWSLVNRWESLLYTNARSCHTATWPHQYSEQRREHINKKLNKLGNYSGMFFEPTHDTTRPLKQGSLALSSDISSFTTLQREQSSVSVNLHTQKHSQANKTWGCI